MKYYLSSYKLGNETEKLKQMIPSNKKVAIIANAMDYSKDKEKRARKEQDNVNEMASVGLTPKVVDLRDYFGKEDELRKKLDECGSVYVRGGNCFVLRLAMKLSGFDNIIKEWSTKQDKLYIAYSAGIGILGPSLDGIQLMDDINVNPYNGHDLIWEGLNFIDYLIIPHYKSVHIESEDADKCVEYCKKKNIKYKTLKDGDVIIIE